MAYILAMKIPGKWIRSNDCKTQKQREIVDEAGGMIQWCVSCELFNSPNRPCFCGGMVLQRKQDGLFWANSVGWVSDWKFAAEHFFSIRAAKKVASILSNDAGTIAIYVIHTGWQNNLPKENIG